MLWLRDKLTGVAAKSPKEMKRGFVHDCLAINDVIGLAKCMQHLVWSWIWCFIAVAVISSCYTFVWSLLVEVDCGMDYLSPNYKWRLGVIHHRSCFLSDGLDHALHNFVLLVRVGRAWFICCTASSKHQPEGGDIRVLSYSN